jgi:hypothetical protein
VRELLSYVREPLLEVVHMSPDFDSAYRPLLIMAQNLVRIDPYAAKNLVEQLIDANPFFTIVHGETSPLSPMNFSKPGYIPLPGRAMSVKVPCNNSLSLIEFLTIMKPWSPIFT